MRVQRIARFLLMLFACKKQDAAGQWLDLNTFPLLKTLWYSHTL